MSAISSSGPSFVLFVFAATPSEFMPSAVLKGRQRFNEAFLAYVHRGTEKAPNAPWELVAYPTNRTFGPVKDVFELEVVRARKVRTEHWGKLQMFVDIILKTLEFPTTSWSILESDTREGWWWDLKLWSSCSVLWKGTDGHCRNGTYSIYVSLHIFLHLLSYHV